MMIEIKQWEITYIGLSESKAKGITLVQEIRVCVHVYAGKVWNRELRRERLRFAEKTQCEGLKVGTAVCEELKKESEKEQSNEEVQNKTGS